MILHDSPFPPTTSHTLACDLHLSPDCHDILDPGSLDAPLGGYPTEYDAVYAGLSHGWLVDIHTPGLDACPACARARIA